MTNTTIKKRSYIHQKLWYPSLSRSLFPTASESEFPSELDERWLFSWWI